MSDKNASRFFSIQIAILSILLLGCAIAWPVAHIVKGTLNLAGVIYSTGMLAGALYLLKHGWKDLRKDFKRQ